MARPIKNKANNHHKKPIHKAKKLKSDGLVASDVYEAEELSDRRKGHDLDEVDNLEYDAGEIDEEDDEEIDSDEAFDESDEERFEGYKFRGSTKTSEKKHLKKANNDDNEINLDEDESGLEDESDLEDEGGFVDLSQMLDGNHEDEDDMDTGAKDDDYDDEDEEEFKGFDDIIDGDDEEEDDDASDNDGLANFVEGLETKKRRRNDSDMPDSKTKRRQLKERNEAYQENEFNLNTRGHDGSNKKISLDDLMSTVNDESTFGSLKEGIETLVGKGKHLTRRALDAPLPKRIQDRMERQAALANTTEEISKWQPTVQMTRAAEHLSFPLQDSSSSPKDGRTSAALASKFKAETTLEQQVQQALADAGMKDEELEAFEALKLNKLTVAEVEARRRELRMMRELMFRSEIKNKRLKKIKSKSYRKLKRKEKEKITSQVQETSEIDFEEENEDKMKAALSRAEERMTLKHKNTSKWAKRALARGVQDEGTREAIMEQLRRGEELRRKIEGSESEDDSDDHDDAAILEEINSLKQDIEQDTQPQKGILSMKFMQDAAKRQSDNLKNEIDEFEKEWLAPDSDNEDKEKEEDNFVMISNNPGRMAFGAKAKQVQSNDEPEQEAREEDQFDTEDATPPVTDSAVTEIKIVETTIEKKQDNKTNKVENKKKEKKTKVKIAASSTVKEAPVQKAQPKSHKNNDDVPLKAPKKSVTFEQRDLVARAFADDDVVAEFEEEKLAEIAEDGDKVEDLTLPGWGAWAGAGVKPKKNKKKIVKITKGIAADKRRDAKLAHVIINEKANKKAEKYQAVSVPYPFKTLEQYERSLTTPVGNEWNTTATFSKMTKPRVLTKLGKVIDPLSAPFV